MSMCSYVYRYICVCWGVPVIWRSGVEARCLSQSLFSQDGVSRCTQCSPQRVSLTSLFFWLLASASQVLVLQVGYQANVAFYMGSGDSNPVLSPWTISWVFSPSFLKLPLRSFVTAARMQRRGCPQRSVLINGPALCCDAWDINLAVSAASRHGQLACHFWGCGEAAHQCRKDMVEQAAHFMVDRKLKEKKRKHRHIPISKTSH